MCSLKLNRSGHYNGFVLNVFIKLINLIDSFTLSSNSEPLDNNAGYWAESFPATDNPLCAAIDPARNYRWHALNCNGPTTSAFLCELKGKKTALFVLAHNSPPPPPQSSASPSYYCSLSPLISPYVPPFIGSSICYCSHSFSVPDWSSHCTMTAMPSVAIHYLADAAAIRLRRDCGDEEGERTVLCRPGMVNPK